jgi:hypothetical protein
MFHSQETIFNLLADFRDIGNIRKTIDQNTICGQLPNKIQKFLLVRVLEQALGLLPKGMRSHLKPLEEAGHINIQKINL